MSYETYGVCLSDVQLITISTEMARLGILRRVLDITCNRPNLFITVNTESPIINSLQ